VSRLGRDPVSGIWTVIAPGRLARPQDASLPAGDSAARGGGAAPLCPFCEGNERLTPPEVDALRPGGTPPDTPGWTVRVVPNKYPVFEGRHEVIVHSPRHDLALADQPLGEVADVVAMYQRRIAALCAAGAAAVTVIVNQGSAAGASLSHPHSQVFATPIVPPVLVEELANFERHRVKYGGCLLCDMLTTTLREGSRVVIDGPLVVWAPEASRFAYELHMAPRAHERDFVTTGASAVAGALKRALAALAAATDDGPLNVWLHTIPCRDEGQFHWHLEIAPRLATLAGLELGTGIWIDLVEPTEAAARLREVLPPGTA
jgi:UDPglucose--hexose-1-phosphate uridylyltransferase